MDNNKFKKICIITSVVLVLLLTALVVVSAYKDKIDKEKLDHLASEYESQLKEQEEKNVLNILGGENTQISELKKADVLLDADDFADVAEHAMFNKKTVTCKVDVKPEASDNLLLYFEARSNKEICELQVNISGASNENNINNVFLLTTQKSAYYIPITNVSDISKFEFKVSDGDSGAVIKSLQLLNNKNKSIPAHLSGVFNISEDVQNIELSVEDISINSAQDVVCNEKYAYVGAANKLYIVSLSNPKKPTVISELGSLGTVRRLELINDKTLAVASREFGVFLIDVSNAQKPSVAGHIASLELASGLDSKGDYLFIASRYYGIEIYDVSIPTEPKFCSFVKSDNVSERIDCTVKGNYLYAGVWASKVVEVFNIGNILEPKYVGYVEAEGTVYGLDTYNDTLVVSMGFNSRKNDSKKVTDMGYGTGNGISLYDISNPDAPSLVSTIKADGRYYNVGNDYWNVRVSDGYAYYTDMHNGLYVFDIANKKAPFRVAKITVPFENGSENYTDLTKDTSVFSFDTGKRSQGSVTGVAIYNGYLYVSNAKTGVHAVKFDKAKLADKNDKTDFSLGKEDKNTTYSTHNFQVSKYQLDGQTFAVCQSGEYIFAATSYGIQSFDRDMKKVEFFKTDTAVRDMRVVDNKLYTAEGIGGVSVYQINGGALKKIGNHKPLINGQSSACWQLGVSPDGKFIITACRFQYVAVLNAKNLQNITLDRYFKTGTLYYRDILLGQINGNTINVFHSSGVLELVFANGSYTYNEIGNTAFSSSLSGVTAFDNNHLLGLHNKGYQIVNISKGFEKAEAEELVTIESVTLRGFPAVKDNILVASNPTTGEIWIIDIADAKNPILKGNIKIKGNPDVAYISSDNTIYVPSRYDGLLKISVL